ncbi:PepSY domain-containing protein [Chryseobacterium lactis]|uniref:PepSY domain-containing protein n=1 Tax=Chryseobacterium lactis TaxID=1241981 RepID=A0A3G6RN29_CHRLC|nr:PepSY-associated TM helix domain-containing protein [Chryseobacterium lactis]AZA83111.1 PepSY domain-containing protein [Chryseobacterium lactis]AZB03494.1 PepSY domain-containing protein [Chryseobacterium lactis]PNW12002.1 PepSY domain-containing protein [Chryseobacterium lactis]
MENKKTNPKKKQGKSLTKRITGWLHLWLGLVSGIIVLTVTLSGTVFVFCDEIIDWCGGSAKYIEVPANTKKMSPEELLVQFQQQVPDRRAFYFDTYKDADRSFRVASATKPPEDKNAAKPKGKGRGPRGVFAYHYLNPYTGKVVGSTKSYEFFYVVAHIHAQLLAGKFGKTVVGIASIIFFIQLIGGLILWWPKKWNKTTRTTAFKIKSGTKWRRKNYDFHNVFGFYSLLPAVFITITGLIMAYKVLTDLTQEAFGGIADPHKITEKYEPKFDPEKKALPFIDFIDRNFKEVPEAKQIRMSVPRNDSSTVYNVVAAKFIGLKSITKGKSREVNKYSGDEINYPKEVQMHEVIEHMNFDLHVGYWGGMFGKIFTFVIGIICTSLPVTGFLIWWGRRNKSPKKKKEIKNIHQQRKEHHEQLV